MANFRGILELIRNFFAPPPETNNRKRRAVDPLEILLSPKCRRLQSTTMARNVIDLDDENYFLSPKPFKRSPLYKTPTSRIVDSVVLDDDDDIVEIKKSPGARLQGRSGISKYTSTPENNPQKTYLNGTDDEDIAFVKEIISPNKKKAEASKLGWNYIKPFSGGSYKFGTSHNHTRSKIKPTLANGFPKKAKNTSRSSLNYSVRLDDKIQYRKLIEAAAGTSPLEDSIYGTPIGKLFNYDTANRSQRILDMALKSPPKSPKLSTKDTIKKVLGNFENDSIVVKDSDSESDVIYVNPPSPKPDFSVEPVNSFKKVVDTSQQTKRDWLDDLVSRHQNYVEQRQQEIDLLRECSEKHGKINKDMRMDILTDKVNKALSIREAFLPVEEKEEEVELPPLTEAQTKMVEKAFRGDPNEVLAKKFNLNITRRDLLTLAGLNWLNDEVINFYMNMIIERGKDSKWPKAYAFNTFFYSKLIKDGPQSLRRWTKRIDLFGHDLVCIPIHLGMHWCMAVIDFRDRSIRYYDSMGSSNKKCLDALKRYLEAEHLDKKKTKYDTSDFILENVKEIPQQMNGSDCGMFSCTFAEFLTRNAKITFNQEHMPYLRKKMVLEILTGELLIHGVSL
ncbi:hypothetical protein JTB14_015511 [Gonioctena quinquepunctata]|nr:hypothetical protein JTB14_015511 [Gonioctena quinquepunctata]